jgi:hypothetical protein
MLKKLCLSFLFLIITVPVAAQMVSLSSLLDEMLDRNAITKFPNPAYLCLQASSYDRASVSPDQPGWFANHDTAQFIREETNGNRREWVLMDAEGPGAIVRWWITAPHYRATFRVYLDGSDTPAIEAKIDDLIGGTHLAGTPAAPSPLSAEKARGRNLYLPIPYAKHCKVTVDNMQGGNQAQGNLYYQINYRTYEKGTNVETFTMDGCKALKNKIDAVQKTMLSADVFTTELFRTNARTIPKGNRPVLLTPPPRFNPREMGVVHEFTLKMDVQDEEQFAKASRSTVISIKFDDKENVWCPLGDFFGSGVGANPYKSWYTSVDKEGTLVSFTSRWQMPFRESYEISLINYGQDDVVVSEFNLWKSPYQWDDRSMYFHADWRQQREIETVAANGTMDWNYIKLKGRGIFVGDVLSILNRTPAWWGEGDEKIYVDGETFPSHFGTGTEDYYGYAWSSPDFFESPFHFQPRAEGPGNYGHATNGRVRLLDGIPFTKDFRFDMEIWHWEKTKIDYAVVNFWYGFAETTLVDFQSREDQIAEVKAAVTYTTPLKFEISGFQIEKRPTAGHIQSQAMQFFTRADRKWNDDHQLWWTGAKPGDKLELILDTEKDGKYKLVGELTKAKDYAVVQFWVNGEKVGAPIDLYNAPDVIPTGAVEIGTVDLKAGKHTVVVEIVGKNDSAEPAFMVGIDRLRLVL